MRRNFLVFSVACTLIMSAAAELSADNQLFNISNSSNQVEGHARAAVSTKTGDVLVTWVRNDPEKSTSTSIYTAVCKRNSEGVYKAGRARLVSSAHGINYSPRVAYGPGSNSYMVVWTHDNRNGDPLVIQGRKIKSNGKPGGKITTLKSSKDYDESDAVIHPLDASGAAASLAGDYLLVWHRRQLDWKNYVEITSGIYTSIFDSRGLEVTEQSLAFYSSYHVEIDDLSYTIPEDIDRAVDGSFVVGGHDYIIAGAADAGDRQAFFLKLDENGQWLATRMAAEGIKKGVRIAQISKRLYMATWCRNQSCYSQLYRKMLKPKGKASQYAGGQTVLSTDIVKLGKDKGSRQIFAGDNTISSVYIKSSGKKAGGIQEHLTDRDVREIYACAVPGTDEIFVAAVIKSGNQQSDVWGLVFSGKK